MSYLGARELARRICAAAHPFLATTGAVVPCGPHTRAASLYDELTTEDGTKTLAVILKARVEGGIDHSFGEVNHQGDGVVRTFDRDPRGVLTESDVVPPVVEPTRA